MDCRIRLSKSFLGKEERYAVESVLHDGYLGMGDQVRFFEQELELFFSNQTSVVCVNTGTSALHLAAQSLGVGNGDEVLIPSLTYVASFQAISATGAKPVACDIDPASGAISIDDLKTKISEKSKAIMYVHYAGGHKNYDEVYRLADKYKLRVIEDAAHAFGSKIASDYVGINGDVVCFSFDGIKNITCGEGGAVCSTDALVIERVRDLRLLGVHNDTQQRYAGKRSWTFDVCDQGWRYHMSNINAAIGREQLRKINTISAIRKKLVSEYIAQLSSLPVQILCVDWEYAVPHIFPILVNPRDRDALMSHFEAANIEVGIHYQPNHLLTKYRGDRCENAEYFWKSVLTLPLHPGLSESDISRVINVIRKYFKNES